MKFHFLYDLVEDQRKFENVLVLNGYFISDIEATSEGHTKGHLNGSSSYAEEWCAN